MPTTRQEAAAEDPNGDRDRDLIDTLPRLGRATTPLERAFGPSCLLSLVILLLLLLVIKRFMTVSWLGMAVLAFFLWFGVLSLLVRWRPDRTPDDD